MWRQIVHWITSSNLGRTCCLQKLFLTFRTIFVPTCSELEIFMVGTCNLMNNLLSFCGLVDAGISASEKDLPIQMNITRQKNLLAKYVVKDTPVKQCWIFTCKENVIRKIDSVKTKERIYQILKIYKIVFPSRAHRYTRIFLPTSFVS